jgi:alkylated DNA repair dioxygenase AlkB
MSQLGLFAADIGVAGFRYQEALLPAEEELKLVRNFEGLPFEPFAFHGYLGNRRVVSFGWRYDYAGATVRKAQAMPPFLTPLRRLAAAFAGLAPEELVHALVTEYAPGAGIGWHRDKPMFGKVVALSFCSACRLRFRRKGEGGWDRQSLDVAPRSAYLLQGEARHVWEHSIPPVEKLRYSVTFRTLLDDFAAAITPS